MKLDLITSVIIFLVIAAVIITAFVMGTLYANTGTPEGSHPGPGYGLMGSGRISSGMMPGGWMGMMAVYSPDAKPISEADARARVQAYAARYGPGVTTGDLMEFSLNYYAVLEDATNASIAEILVDRYDGSITPEPGPNMMWNTRYGAGQGRTGAVTYDLNGGKNLAETFLAAYLPGATIQESTTFPGYYTFDFGRGTTEGMLSVNAYTGDVWVHTWHGQYIRG